MSQNFVQFLNRLFSQIPVINDDLPLRVLSGSVIIKPNVKEICGSTVVFEDGTTVEKVKSLFQHIYKSSCISDIIFNCSFFSGGYDCLCHRVQLWFPLLTK